MGEWGGGGGIVVEQREGLLGDQREGGIKWVSRRKEGGIQGVSGGREGGNDLVGE